MKSAARVGLFLVVFIALVIGGYAVLGRSLFAKTRDKYTATFADAGGIVSGTQVLLAGVKVGAVTKIELVSPTEARMSLELEKGTQLPTGTMAVIPGSLIGLGDTPVQLMPPAHYLSFLSPGAVIPGHKAGPLDALLPDGGKSAYNEINRTLVAVRKIMEDQKLQTDIKMLLKTTNATLQESQGTLKSFQLLASRGTSVLDQNQGNINAIMIGARETLAEVHQSATSLAALIKQGKLQNGAIALLDKANRIADQSAKLLASVDKTMNDPELQRNLKAVARNAANTSEKGPAIAENASQVSSNLVTLTKDSKELPAKLGAVLDKAGKLEDQLSSLADKVGGVFDHKPSNIGIKNLSTEMDLFRQTQPGYWRTDFGATIPLSDGFINLGLYDAFESNKLTAQVGKTVGSKLDYRYGIYASKPALGVDYTFGRRVSLRNDLWDINSPRLDTKLKFDFGNGLIGWFGADRLFRDNAPTFGIGIRK